MMEESISHAGFMDITRLRVTYLKMLIAAVPILFDNQIGMKHRDIFYEVVFEHLYVFLLLFPAQKLFPGVKQVLGGDDIVVGMNDADSIHPPERTPPPDDSAREIRPRSSHIERSVSCMASSTPARR